MVHESIRFIHGVNECLPRTVKLCYSESGRPRHIFSLLPSSRYSQMTNLPRETKGNNLGTGAVDLRRLAMWWGLRHTRPTCGARTPTAPCALEPDEDERRERGLHTEQRTRLSLFFFVTGHHEMCPTGNLTTRWGWGEWRWTFVTRKDRKSLVITEIIIH